MERDYLKFMQEKMPELSKSHKAIASYIIDHPDTAAYFTATKLGNAAGVSESTVVRFANELGFKGFPEMQKALSNQLRSRMNSVQRVAAATSIMDGADILSKIMTRDMERIKSTLDEVDRDAFYKTVEMLTNAKHIYIIGMRSASMLASFFAYNLNIILNNVTLLDMTSKSDMFERLMWISECDVFVGISFPRYSKRTRNAMEFAGGRGAKILAITDSESSPIAANCDCALFAKSDIDRKSVV